MKKIKYIHNLKDHNLDIPREILPVVIEGFDIKTVIDVGGGVGAFTKYFLDHGIDALCVDGSWVNKDNLYIDEKFFIERDLEKFYDFGKKYDLALSLEVAEHLGPNAAKNFVKTLCTCSDYVIFSAAFPNQGGQNHINEQPPEYWKDLFEKEGYEIIDCFRTKLWNNKKIPWWYKNNIFLYYKKGTVLPKNIKDEKPLYVIHPDAYNELKIARNSIYLTFRHFIYNILKKFKFIK